MIFSKRWKFFYWKMGFKKSQRRKCTIFILSELVLTHRKTQEGHRGTGPRKLNIFILSIFVLTNRKSKEGHRGKRPLT